MPADGPRRRPYVALAALVVALAALAIWRPGQHDDPQGTTGRLTLPLPTSFGDWTYEDDAATSVAQSALQQSVSDGGAAVEVALALYDGASGDRARITVFLPRPGSTTARDLAADPSAQLDAFLRGSGVTSTQAVESGESGVPLVCGSADGEFATACGWADSAALVLVAYDRPDLQEDAAADLTRQIRDGLLAS